MSTRLRGVIEALVPVFHAHIDDDGVIALGEGGDMPLRVDTGFSGSIALPSELLGRIGAELVDFGVFRLATGDEVELPVYWGKVSVGAVELETWFIPGDSLLGMEFLSLVGSSLSMDLERGVVELVVR